MGDCDELRKCYSRDMGRLPDYDGFVLLFYSNPSLVITSITKWVNDLRSNDALAVVSEIE